MTLSKWKYILPEKYLPRNSVNKMNVISKYIYSDMNNILEKIYMKIRFWFFLNI